MSRYAGHPVPLDRVVARTPTLTVGLGRVVVDPDGVAFQVVAEERRLPRDRPRVAATDQLFIRRADAPRPSDDEPGFGSLAWTGVEGGGGHSRGGFLRSDWYVRGVPAEGDLELVVTVWSHDVDVVVVLDGDVLRRAAACATPLWGEG